MGGATSYVQAANNMFTAAIHGITTTYIRD